MHPNPGLAELVPATGLPELVEGRSFSLQTKRKEPGFDKLSQAGLGVRGGWL